MRKKLNRKLKFALAGFGAFALAGVSCVGLVSLESQDAIASFAIDTPSADNPVELGVLTFTKSGSAYFLDYPSYDIDLGSYTSNLFTYTIRFVVCSSDGYSESQIYSEVLTSSGISSEGSHLLLSSGSVILSSFNFSAVGDNPSVYLRLYTSSTNKVVIDFNHTSFVLSSIDANVYYTEPVLPPVPTPVDFVHEIVDILTAGIVNLGHGIGQGVSSFVQSLAFNSAGDGLSVYFVLVCVFGGIALAVALTSKVFMWLNGLGA